MHIHSKVCNLELELQDTFGYFHLTRLFGVACQNFAKQSGICVPYMMGENLDLNCLPELVYVAYFFPKPNYVAYKGVAYKP